MQKRDTTIYSKVVDEHEILISRKSCRELYDTFDELKFSLQGTYISIKPKGYLYHIGNQKDCFIGIQSIPDKYNQYRLGTIFLRNFYTGLDFANNLLLIGINKGTTAAQLHGKLANPYKPSDLFDPIFFVIVFIIVMLGIAIACFIRSKRIENANRYAF